jgi:hypothetical protein
VGCRGTGCKLGSIVNVCFEKETTKYKTHDKLTDVEDDKSDKFLSRHIGRCRQCIRHMLVTRENG